jgi:hypothetical protein
MIRKVVEVIHLSVGTQLRARPAELVDGLLPSEPVGISGAQGVLSGTTPGRLNSHASPERELLMSFCNVCASMFSTLNHWIQPCDVTLGNGTKD